MTAPEFLVNYPFNVSVRHIDVSASTLLPGQPSAILFACEETSPVQERRTRASTYTKPNILNSNRYKLVIVNALFEVIELFI